jgi:hypothetical protein
MVILKSRAIELTKCKFSTYKLDILRPVLRICDKNGEPFNRTDNREQDIIVFLLRRF